MSTTRDLRVRFQTIDAEKADKAIAAVDASFAEMAQSAEAGAAAAREQAQAVQASAAAATKAEKDVDRNTQANRLLATELEQVSREARITSAALNSTASTAHATSGGVSSLNQQVKEGFEGFDEFGARVGQIANALNLLSGAMLIGVITAFVSSIKTVYEWTDAGKEAKREAEALAAAFGQVSAEVTKVGELTDVAADQFVRLASATAEATAEEEAYRDAITEAVEEQAELNKSHAEYDRLVQAARVGQLGMFESRKQAADSILVYTARLKRATAAAEANRIALEEKRRVQEQVRAEVIASTTALSRRIDHMVGETKAQVASTAALLRHRIALAAAGGEADGVTGVLGRLAGAGLQVADAVGEKVTDALDAASSSASKTTKAVRSLFAVIDEATRNTTGESFFARLEALGPPDEMQAYIEQLTAGITDPSGSSVAGSLLDADQQARQQSQQRERDRRLELLAANDDLDPEILRREQMLAEIALIDEQHARERALAEQHGEDLVVLDAVFDERRTRSRERFAKLRTDAAIAEAKAVIGTASGMIGAVGEFAAAANESEGVQAVIKRLGMLADAADSFADIPILGPVAAIRGAAKLVAAAAYQRQASAAGVSGGGGGSVPSPPTSTSTPGPADLPPRGRDGTTNLSITVDGSLFMDHDAMVSAIREGAGVGDSVGYAPMNTGRAA